MYLFCNAYSDVIKQNSKERKIISDKTFTQDFRCCYKLASDIFDQIELEGFKKNIIYDVPIPYIFADKITSFSISVTDF